MLDVKITVIRDGVRSAQDNAYISRGLEPMTSSEFALTPDSPTSPEAHVLPLDRFAYTVMVTLPMVTLPRHSWLPGPHDNHGLPVARPRRHSHT